LQPGITALFPPHPLTPTRQRAFAIPIVNVAEYSGLPTA